MARRTPISFETVSALGLKLPGAEAGIAYGSPALKVNGQMFACMAVNKSAEPDTLAVRLPIDHRDDLLAEAPDIYYVTDHYVAYPIVLVRLARISLDALQGLLAMGHRSVATDTSQRKRRQSGGGSGRRIAKRK